MNNELFDKEKHSYENTKIPDNLDVIVKNTLKKGKNRSKAKKIYKVGTTLVASFITFVLIINLSPSVANAISNIPLVGKLSELVKFDKGLDNAIEHELVKNLNIKEEKNGIVVNVNNVVGDWKRLWIEYKLESNNLYDCNISVKTIDGLNNINGMYGYDKVSGEDSNYIEIGFEEFTSEFILEFNIFNKGEDIDVETGRTINAKYIETFQIVISLDEIFNSKLESVDIKNKIINTEIGNIEVENISTSKTRTIMDFNLKSDEFDFMSFENPRLIDNEGNIYNISRFYTSDDTGDGKSIEFNGELANDIKSLEFQCDGVYYARKADKNISVNLIEGFVAPNNYGIEFLSFKDNILKLKSNDIKSISFNNIEKEYSVKEISISNSSDNNFNETIIELKIENFNENILDLEIYWVQKDITSKISSKLIE